MSIPLFVEDIIPKYVNGKWTFNDKRKTFVFKQTGDPRPPDYEVKAPKLKFGIKFRDSMSQIEEVIYNRRFARPVTSKDSDVITIQDIKNLILFLAPTKDISYQMIKFLHQDTLDQFFNDLIIYFEYFLKLVEFLLIRRDETTGGNGKMHNAESVKVDQLYSTYLGHYRLILARDYSKIVIGSGDMYPFHHLNNKQKKSLTNKDGTFFETFLCISTRIVWIAHHRRAYAVIDAEINRLFRSSHFNVAEKQISNCLKFTKREEEILYGINNKLVNCRNQKSPLALEILNILPENVDVIGIGVNKYRGNNVRLKELEYEYVIPDAQLRFIDVQHGILGHPKSLYDTMLYINWYAVRNEMFTESYDPYCLIRRPRLIIPDVKQLDEKYVTENSLFKFEYDKRYDRKMIADAEKTWKEKERLLFEEAFAVEKDISHRDSKRQSSVLANAITIIDFESDFDLNAKSKEANDDKNMFEY